MKLLIIGVLAAMAAASAPAAQQGQSGQASSTPAAQQGQAPTTPAQPARTLKSKEEQEALQAVFQATNSDARITAAENFITKFPKSDFLALALFAEAQSYQQKNDYEKMVVYAERSLDANPDDATKVQTELMLARGIAQRTREFDLDREEKLARVEKYANSALDILKTLPKPNPSLSDEQWNDYKAQMASDAHDALGMDALVRKNNDEAIKEFKTSVSETKEPNPTTQVRLALAYHKAGKYDDAIGICDTVLKTPNLPPQIQQVAQTERADAVKAKNGGQKPAAPAGTAQPAPAPAPATKP